MTRTFRSVSVLFAIPVIASVIASTAHGHARLKNPQPRDNQDGYKDPPRTPPGTGAPCGISEATTQPHTTLTPGMALTVTWEETVTHPGCFVIDFSPANDANFTVLGVKSHMNAPAPANPTTSNPRQWSVGVTLPTTPCPKCTLRLRQLMLASDVADSACPPATIPSGSTYYSCANIALSGSGGATGTGGAGGAAGSSGTTGGRGGTTAAGGRGGNAAGGRGGTTGQAGTSGQAGSTGQAGTTGQAGNTGQTGQAGTSGQAGDSGQTGQAGTSGQAGDNGQTGQAGTGGQAGSTASGQAGNGSTGVAGNGTSGGAGSSGQTGTGASGGDGATGGCGIAGGQPAPWGLLLALILLRRIRRRSRS